MLVKGKYIKSRPKNKTYNKKPKKTPKNPENTKECKKTTSPTAKTKRIKLPSSYHFFTAFKRSSTVKRHGKWLLFFDSL